VYQGIQPVHCPGSSSVFHTCFFSWGNLLRGSCQRLAATSERGAVLTASLHASSPARAALEAAPWGRDEKAGEAEPAGLLAAVLPAAGLCISVWKNGAEPLRARADF